MEKFSDVIVTEQDIEENLRRVNNGEPLTMPLKQLSPELKIRYGRETRRIVSKLLNKNPEYKIREREWQKKYRQSPKFKIWLAKYKKKRQADPNYLQKKKENYKKYMQTNKYKFGVKLRELYKKVEKKNGI